MKAKKVTKKMRDVHDLARKTVAERAMANVNWVGALQESLAKTGEAMPVYANTLTTGSHHLPTHTVACTALGLTASAEGSTRQLATRRAAQKWIDEAGGK